MENAKSKKENAVTKAYNEAREANEKAREANEAFRNELAKAIADEKARENMGEYFYYIGKSSTTLNLRASAIEKIAFLYELEKKNIPNAINENKSPVLYGAVERAIKANSDQFYRLRDKTYRD